MGKKKVENYFGGYTLSDFVEGKDEPKPKSELRKFLEYSKETLWFSKKEKEQMKKMTELMVKETMKVTKSMTDTLIK